MLRTIPKSCGLEAATQVMQWLGDPIPETLQYTIDIPAGNGLDMGSVISYERIESPVISWSQVHAELDRYPEP